MAKKLSDIFATNPAAALTGNELVEFTQSGTTVVGTAQDIVDLLPVASYLDEDPASTTGLTWGWKSGLVRSDAVVVTVSAGTLTLGASATNYVQVTAAGVVSSNTTAFSAGSIPLRTVVTGASAITTSTDMRTWISVPASGPYAALSGNSAQVFNVGNATLPTEAVNLEQSLGLGQTWQDVTASRSYGSVYTNSTASPIEIFLSNVALSTGIDFILNGVKYGHYDTGTASLGSGVVVIIPPTWSYNLTLTVGSGLGYIWSELR